jgi:hypothetical protein
MGDNGLPRDIVERKRFVRKKYAESGKRISEQYEKLIDEEP